LQDALAVQKSVQERRFQQQGTTAKVQLWIDQELEVLVSTIDAEKTLEQLLEDRAVLHKQLDQIKVKDFLLHIGRFRPFYRPRRPLWREEIQLYCIFRPWH
jgi:hypothetical protein